MLRSVAESHGMGQVVGPILTATQQLRVNHTSRDRGNHRNYRAVDTSSIYSIIFEDEIKVLLIPSRDGLHCRGMVGYPHGQFPGKYTSIVEMPLEGVDHALVPGERTVRRAVDARNVRGGCVNTGACCCGL